MNGRIHEDETPEGRIAAVARSLAIKMEKAYQRSGVGPKEPDYADYRAALKPFIDRELILARMDEGRMAAAKVLTGRARELSEQLVECERAIIQAELR